MRSCNDTMRFRIKFQAGILLLIFFALVVRLYWVQVKDHDSYLKEARKKYITSKKIIGTRGQIFDRHGNLLVGNMPCEEVFITPCNIKPQNDILVSRIIAGCVGMSFHDVYNKVSAKTRKQKQPDGSYKTVDRQYALIARRVPLLQTRRLRELLKKNDVSKGVHYKEDFVRYYPKGRLMSNVLGVTSPDKDNLLGKTGIEKVFDKILSSQSGLTTYGRSRDGRKLDTEPQTQENSQNGLDLYLTFSEPIQAILEEELDKACEKWNPRAVYAIMADPATGNIIAMAQRPSYDPNNRSVKNPLIYRTLVIEDMFEPGSIMKPLTIAGALDNNIVRPETRIDCENGVWIYKKSRLTDTHGYGIQDVTGVVRKSSNIGTAKIAIAMEKELLYKTLRSFGLGEKSGIELTPEQTGRLKKPARWDSLSISRFGMGYGVAVTPVQMLRAYCALANRGRLPQLRILDRRVDPVNNVEIRENSRVVKNIFKSPATGEQIVNMMVTVTEKGGTATRAAIPGYRVAGKTGTAHKLQNGRYVNKYYASFVGFVPAEKPAFVLLMTFDEPKGAHYGGVVVCPAWKAIAERTLKYMNIPPSTVVDATSDRQTRR